MPHEAASTNLTAASHSRNRLLVYSLSLLLILTPVIMTWLLIAGVGGYKVPDYYPTSSDEKYYWHQILTFQVAGFDGGYYTIDEVPAKASFSNYYTKGPLFPMIYGSISRLTGWGAASGLYMNLLALTAALAILVYSIRFDRRQLAMSILMLMTSWPLLLFAYNMTMEAIVAVSAILTANIFINLIRRDEPVRLALKILFVATLFVASQLRGGTWVPLIVIFFVIAAHDKRLSRLLFDLLKGLIVGAVSFWIFSQLSQPRSNLFSTMPTSRAGIRITLDRIVGNLGNFNRGRAIWLMLRYQTLLLSLGAAGVVLRELWQKRQTVNNILVDRPRWFWEAVFHAVNLGGVLAANVVLYNMFDWRDYRVIAPHLLISALVLIAFRRYRIVAVLIIANLLVTGSFLSAFAELSAANFQPDRRPAVAFTQSINGHLIYDAQATSPWCNTLLLVDDDLVFDIDVVGIPGGIGISRMSQTPRQIEQPFRSRYLLIRDETRTVYGDDLNVRLLSQTPIGGLYLNQDADCDAHEP